MLPRVPFSSSSATTTSTSSSHASTSRQPITTVRRHLQSTTTNYYSSDQQNQNQNQNINLTTSSKLTTTTERQRSANSKSRPLEPITAPISLASINPTTTIEKKDTIIVKAKESKAKLTELWGSPPRTARRDNGDIITRGALLGEGGFARVYLATEANGDTKAIKVISKQQLKSTKNKSKLFGEIKIHQAMRHPNVVHFEQCFEDDGNVYMQLELCSNGSLLDLLRKRKRYTEPEARFYLVQLIGACEYMHTNSVIHRDLKLGNLMLDEGMNLRVGDFGLAALVKFPGERKKTICGTPNYIAPEILFDTTNGHSFEVDVWSIGVILYTLLVGRPPFQTKDVKSIYRKIKENSYEFPSSVDLSTESISLIQAILTTSPESRPTLSEILAHDWFLTGPFPLSISKDSMDSIPDFRSMSIRASHRNFKTVKKLSGIIEVLGTLVSTRGDEVETIQLGLQNVCLPPLQVVREEDEEEGEGVEVVEVKEVRKVVTALATTKEARGMEKEVREVLQPGSPICELLRSARKPLMISPVGEPREVLQRKLQAEARLAATSSTNNPPPPFIATHSRSTNSQLVGTTSKATSSSNLSSRGQKENVVPSREMKTMRKVQVPGENGVVNSRTTMMESKTVSSRSDGSSVDPSSTRYPARELYEKTWRALHNALTIESTEQLEALPNPSPLITPKVFITSWVDYTHKYGTAYSLTDGSAGLYFNDSTTMVLSPNKVHFDYISNRKGNIYSRRHYKTKEHPIDLERKVYLLEYFEDYMSKTLMRDVEWNFIDTERNRNMDFLVKYYRMKNAIVFKMSNEVLQFNFYDHTKLLLTENGTIITFIDKSFNLKTYSLLTLFLEASRLGYYRPTPDPLQDPRRKLRLEGIKFLIEKLNYCRDVLQSLSTRKPGASSSSTVVGGERGREA